jgi:hypothetical protein
MTGVFVLDAAEQREIRRILGVIRRRGYDDLAFEPVLARLEGRLIGAELLGPAAIDAAFIRTFATWDDDPVQHEPFLVCEGCGVKLCSIEEGDRFNILAAVVADHTCETNS